MNLDPDTPTDTPIKSLWACIDPCAFLCYMVQTNQLQLDAEVHRTLDNFGWLNKDGFPDYDKMNREFMRPKT